MRYITDTGRGFDHRPYWDYLKSVKDWMPAHAWQFASNSENHDLTSPNSLHDSWFEYLKISERSVADRKCRALDVELCLLGPRHDRRIYLLYKDVLSYALSGAKDFAGSPLQTPHGDLLVHEMIAIGRARLSHELVFSKGAVFTVEFAEFEHRIQELTG